MSTDEKAVLLAFLLQPGDYVEVVQRLPEWTYWMPSMPVRWKSRVGDILNDNSWGCPRARLDDGYWYPIQCLKMLSSHDS